MGLVVLAQGACWDESPPAPPPPAAPPAPADPLYDAKHACLQIAQSKYPGIDWSIFSMGSARMSGGVMAQMAGERNGQHFRIDCFGIEGDNAAPTHELRRLDPITMQPL